MQIPFGASYCSVHVEFSDEVESYETSNATLNIYVLHKESSFFGESGEVHVSSVRPEGLDISDNELLKYIEEKCFAQDYEKWWAIGDDKLCIVCKFVNNVQGFSIQLDLRVPLSPMKLSEVGCLLSTVLAEYHSCKQSLYAADKETAQIKVERDRAISTMEEFVDRDFAKSSKLLQQFVLLLNTKKARISQLEAEIKALKRELKAAENSAAKESQKRRLSSSASSTEAKSKLKKPKLRKKVAGEPASSEEFIEGSATSKHSSSYNQPGFVTQRVKLDTDAISDEEASPEPSLTSSHIRADGKSSPSAKAVAAAMEQDTDEWEWW